MNELNLARDRAKSLRRSMVQTLGPAAETVTHSQALEIYAGALGHADWNTAAAAMQGTYFYARHEPYLPMTAPLLVGMSVRKAVAEEVSPVPHGVDDPWLPRALKSIERTKWQFDKARSGELEVANLVANRLPAGVGESPESLELTEMHLARHFADMLGATCGGLRADRGQYQATYLAWRVSSLMRAWASWEGKTEGPSLMQFEGLSLDLYAYASALLTGRVLPSELFPQNLREILGITNFQGKELRAWGKAFALSWLAGDTPELAVATVRETFGLEAPTADIRMVMSQLDAAFPEVRAWQTWLEIKPLVAPDADKFHRERTR